MMNNAELEYRAWHIFHKKRYMVKQIDFARHLAFLDEWNDWVHLSWLILEQHVFQKDVHNTKVFVGDILDNNLVVKFEIDAFVVYQLDDEDSYEFLSNVHVSQCEVTGQIIYQGE